MDWLGELGTSLLWVSKAFGLSIFFLVLIGFILIKTTKWAAQFWRIGGGYFHPTRHPLSLCLYAVILFLSLFGVRISVLLSNWNSRIYTALQEKDAHVFWLEMVVFLVLAITHIFRLLISFYLSQYFSITWREVLNKRLLGKWMNKQNYYRFYFLKNPMDNPDQRIQHDIVSFVESSLHLSLGLISSMVSAFAFTVILWNLSASMTFWGVTIPRFMVFMVFVYVLIVTVFAFKIGRPLIRLNFLNERLSANYRYSLIRVREYAESIAFYHGEKMEEKRLQSRFDSVIGNLWAIVHRSLKLQGFNFLASQVAVVFPFLIQAPRFFSGQIKLGAMMQTAQAFGHLQAKLSFFREAYSSFSSYKATLDRLSGFLDNVEQAQALEMPTIEHDADRVALRHATISTPYDQVLVKDLNFDVNAGQSLLIKGPSGAGKTTILRTMAGLWPYCQGHIICPKEGVLFLSQKPYLPEGNLMDVLYYPNAVPDHAQDQVVDILEKVHLGHLSHRLQEELNWMHTLSLGEQQRVAFARLLLATPKVAFLDEATSAMDEGLEDAMYRLIHKELPQLHLISVGHRSTLLIHHDRVLELEKDGAWSIKTMDSVS